MQHVSASTDLSRTTRGLWNQAVEELEAGGWGVEMKEGKTKFRGFLLTGLRAEGFVAGKVLERRCNLPVVIPRQSGRH